MWGVDLGGTAAALAPRADVTIEPHAVRPSGSVSPQHRDRRMVEVVCIVAEHLGVSAIAGALTYPAVAHCLPHPVLDSGKRGRLRGVEAPRMKSGGFTGLTALTARSSSEPQCACAPSRPTPSMRL